jgi:hypothetical protein
MEQGEVDNRDRRHHKGPRSIATLLSILIAIDQLTAAGRFRRREAFWRAAADGESANRKAQLESLRREAVAQLLAREAMRLYEFERGVTRSCC